MYNYITAVTNAPCIYPLYHSLKNKDYLTTSVLVFVSIASVVSHLAENHKHGMPGVFKNVTQNTSYLLNRIDVLGSMLTIARLSYLYYKKFGLSLQPFFTHPLECFFMLLPLVFLRISEYDKFNPKLRTMYLVMHSAWHLTVFTSIGYYLTNFIY